MEHGFKPEFDPKALFFLPHQLAVPKKPVSDLCDIIGHFLHEVGSWEEVLLSHQQGFSKTKSRTILLVLMDW